MMKEYPIAYAAYNFNSEIRYQSTSGGVFSIIADYLIENHKAIVYGASFDSDFDVQHIRIDSCLDIAKLRGSKYPQSKIGNCFKQIKKDLDDNRNVLFVGTPCQVAGLENYLGHDYKNLYTMDFVCHGVASNGVWRDYVRELGRNRKITNIIFKYKYKGWKKWYFQVLYDDGSIWHRRGSMTKFMRSYLNYGNVRPSCYYCKFKGLKRISDFTISDCWGIGENDTQMNDNGGLSALLLQNDKATILFDEIKSQLKYKKYDALKLMEGNWTTFKPVLPDERRYDFFKCVAEKSALEGLNIFYRPSLKSWIKYYYLRVKGLEK